MDNKIIGRGGTQGSIVLFQLVVDAPPRSPNIGLSATHGAQMIAFLALDKQLPTF